MIPLKVIFLLLLLGLKLCSPLCTTHFPKVLGGTNGPTFLSDIYANQNTIYVCGSSCDDNIFPSTVDFLFLIGAFDISSNSLKWAFIQTL